jgi:AraC family transcriptional regulator of adaptative response/methylated-DNA-[protein]-cysteine methyltransferase
MSPKPRAENNLARAKDRATAKYSSELSGPGRLHDPLVTYETVSPGKFKSGAIDITYGIHRSPFGWCVIGITKRGICQLAFIEADSAREAVRLIQVAWPHARLTRDQARTKFIYKKYSVATQKQNAHSIY